MLQKTLNGVTVKKIAQKKKTKKNKKIYFDVINSIGVVSPSPSVKKTASYNSEEVKCFSLNNI